jgi:hypothetical protein
MAPKYTFRVSHRKDKKYDALLADGRVIHFGGVKRDGKPYDQFKDSTPLKAFSKYDHNDKTRRERFYKRHGPLDESNPYTADWFSKKYLW